MSTAPPNTSPPDPVLAPVPLNAPSGSPIETAPSTMVEEGPLFSRGIAFAGLFFLFLGAAAVIAKRAIGSERIISEGLGYLFATLGLTLLLYHSITDRTVEVRRGYGAFAVFWFVVALAFSLVPGPFEGSANKTVGYYLLQYGVGAGLLSLLFALPFVRHETDEAIRYPMLAGLLIVGALLIVASALAGIIQPDFLTGPGIALGLLGLAFLCGYLGQVDTSEDLGYYIAFSLGAFGGLLIVYALGRAIVPTILYEGPSALRKPNQALDQWKVLGRALVIMAFAILAGMGLLGKFPGWLRATFGLLGIVGAGVFIVASFNAPIHVQPRPSLVPGGVILTGLGLLYLAVSIGICSDNQFVTLTRRELAAFFLSPIGFLVLAAMAAAQWISYFVFILELTDGQPRPEPVVREYGMFILNIFALVILVPVLTMRLFAEEKRTGSLEVLLTAPVNEVPVVASKFLASWIFFLICWIPFGLYLIALRVVADTPFDYRPVLGFYLALAAQGVMFIGIGLFFSVLTRNQVVAAMFTALAMIVLLLCTMLRFFPGAFGLPQTFLDAVGRLSFYHMLRDSLAGQLPVRDLALFVSFGLFWLFLAVKVLEARKWS
jgi:hypothetical protein